MRKYEMVCIFVPNMEEEERNGLLDKIKGIIETDGQIEKIDEWGLRKLAYEIKDYVEGHYVVINFQAGKEVIDELDRVIKITDKVIRHMIVKEEE